jgi:hypothetical protein
MYQTVFNPVISENEGALFLSTPLNPRHPQPSAMLRTEKTVPSNGYKAETTIPV